MSRLSFLSIDILMRQRRRAAPPCLERRRRLLRQATRSVMATIFMPAAS